MKTICCTKNYLASSIKPTRTSATLNHTKSIMLLLQERFLQRQKEVRRKLIQIQPLSRSLPQSPKKRKKRSLEKEAEGYRMETISEAVLTEENVVEDELRSYSSHTFCISSSETNSGTIVVQGMDVEGAKSDDDATYVEDKGNETVKDTNANLEGRNDEMTDVTLPQVQATQEAVDVVVTEVMTEFEKILILKINNLVNDQLESEVLVRSSKEAKTSHAVAANLSELELKKILIDKMEANNSIKKVMKLKRSLPGISLMHDDQEPSARTDWGSKRRRLGKEPESTSAPRETTTMTAGKTTTSSKTYKQSASQSAPVEEIMQYTDVL
ncbi:hypothetical protein Tco_0514274 [Tanacetum coccineum]